MVYARIADRDRGRRVLRRDEKVELSTARLRPSRRRRGRPMSRLRKEHHRMLGQRHCNPRLNSTVPLRPIAGWPTSPQHRFGHPPTVSWPTPKKKGQTTPRSPTAALIDSVSAKEKNNRHATLDRRLPGIVPGDDLGPVQTPGDPTHAANWLARDLGRVTLVGPGFVLSAHPPTSCRSVSGARDRAGWLD